MSFPNPLISLLILSLPPHSAKAIAAHRWSMAASVSLDYPPFLQEYAVSEQEYLRQHPQYDLLVTGAVVFNNEGKLLLVQRAADEKAFPTLWVS